MPLTAGTVTPPGAISHHPQGTRHPTGHAHQRASAGSTPAHPRPKEVNSGPRLPAPMTGSTGREIARPQTLLAAVRGTPPRTPPCHRNSAQHRFPGVHAVGPVHGPHTHTIRAQKTWTTWPSQPPQGRAAGRGGAPDARRPSKWREVCAPGATSCHPCSARRSAGHARQTNSAGSSHLNHMRPENMGNGARVTAPRMGSRERESA